MRFSIIVALMFAMNAANAEEKKAVDALLCAVHFEHIAIFDLDDSIVSPYGISYEFQNIAMKEYTQSKLQQRYAQLSGKMDRDGFDKSLTDPCIKLLIKSKGK